MNYIIVISIKNISNKFVMIIKMRTPNQNLDKNRKVNSNSDLIVLFELKIYFFMRIMFFEYVFDYFIFIASNTANKIYN
jgi:hypothetical protein